MSTDIRRRARYRTWVRGTRLRRFAAVSGVCLAGSALSPLSPWFLLFLIPFALFGYITMILALTVYRLAPRGGDLQRRIHELIVAKLGPVRRAGCLTWDVAAAAWSSSSRGRCRTAP